MKAPSITPERLRLLLIERGMSYGDVAAELGVSRSSIAGRARRAGIVKSQERSVAE